MSVLDRYLSRRRWWEAGAWIALMLGEALANGYTVALDLRRTGAAFEPWQPYAWEFSSTLVLLALLPLLLAVDRRFPLWSGRILRHLPAHVLATLPFSALHVAGMVALREAAYAAMGGDYAFGDWRRELLYEYLKDARTYFLLLAAVYLYRHVLLRLQGEARLLDRDDDQPPAPAAAPERAERFLVRKFGKEFLVAAADIEWIESAENYVNLHVRGHVYPLRSTMAGVLERLDPARFVRVHRRYIVNLDQLASIEPLDTGDAWIHLRDGTRIACSRRHREALRAAAA